MSRPERRQPAARLTEQPRGRRVAVSITGRRRADVERAAGLYALAYPPAGYDTCFSRPMALPEGQGFVMTGLRFSSCD